LTNQADYVSLVPRQIQAQPPHLASSLEEERRFSIYRDTDSDKVREESRGQNTRSQGKEIFLKEKVEEVLKNIRPSLQADGGDVELVDVKEGIVSLRLKGACAGCPMSTMTLKNGIERILKEEISGIKEVVAV
jgi:Fe-S cluster biogenesis protein NfuA